MQSQAPIRYTVTIADPHTHAIRVRIDLDEAPQQVRISMPSWSPGSYLLREFARQISTLHASSPNAGGGAVRCRKVTRGTWAIEHVEGAPLRVEYVLNAQERTVRTPYLDAELGFFVGTNVFAFVEGEEAHAAEVRFELPQGWVAHCSRIEGFTGRTFVARDYDELADCAVALARSPEAGGPAVHRFEACGKPHGFVVLGDGRFDLERVLAETKACVEASAALFSGGELPYARYLFVQLFTGDYRGGLEHLDSCALAYPRTRIRGEDDHIDYMMLVAHEFFHVWNVKRVHSDVLGPFDYTAENYTRDLWIGEGWTSYFQHHIGLRAGVIDAARFLEILGKRVAAYERAPGRHVQSLQESSFDAWIKLYRADADSPNTTVSYYLKGSLVACLLDLEIRRRTHDERSLLDVFRHLWREFGQRGVGYPEGSVQQQVEAVVGGDFTDFFDRCVRGTDALPWDEALAHVGLRRVEDRPQDASPWFGAVVGGSDGLTLGTTYADGPARAGGLMAGDVLVALDGYRVAPNQLDDMLRAWQAGDAVEVAFFREGQLRAAQVTLGEARPKGIKIAPVESPSAEQQASLEAWLGALPDEA